jgi:hypothetical protein
MNKKKQTQKFVLNKRTVADLTRYEQSRVMAGDGERCELTWCYASGSAVLKSSTVIVNTNTTPIGTDPRLWPCYMPITTDTR